VHGAGLNLGGSVAFGQAMQRLINLGTIEADAGTVQVVALVFENRGVATATGGTLNLSSGTNTNMAAGVVEAKNGGSMTIANFGPNTGTMSAGAGGVITVIGTFANSATGTVDISLGGAAANQYGRIAVSGAATLNGTVRLRLANGYVPLVGQTFSVMTYASRSGTFALLSDEDVGDGITYSATYNPTNVILTAIFG
jgi:hypothetical protein